MMITVSGLHLLLMSCGIILIVLGCIAWRQPRAGNRVAYWHQTIAGLDETPERFYAQVYQALKESLQIRRIALTGFGFGPTRLFEGGHIFTERPLYLEARYKHLRYYLYVGQSPAGFYISTWLYSKYVVGDDKPAVLPAGFRYFSRQSLFQYDATLMFNESVHSIVMEVLDRYIREQQLTPLTDAQRCPVMHAFYGRGMPTASLPTTTLPAMAALFGATTAVVTANGVTGALGAHSSPGADAAISIAGVTATEATNGAAPIPNNDVVPGSIAAGDIAAGDMETNHSMAGDAPVVPSAEMQTGGVHGRKLPL